MIAKLTLSPAPRPRGITIISRHSARRWRRRRVAIEEKCFGIKGLCKNPRLIKVKLCFPPDAL